MKKIRLSTSTNILFNRPGGVKADIFEIIEFCHNAGYRYLDFNFHDMGTFNTEFCTKSWKEWLKTVKCYADELGIEFNQGHSFFYDYFKRDVPDRNFKEELVRRSIEGAGILKIKNLVTHAGTDYYSSRFLESSKEKNLIYFDELLNRADELGVVICFENLWDLNIYPTRKYTSNAEELLDLVEEFKLNHKNVGVCWDIEHSEIMQQDLKRELTLVKDHLRAIHLSDFTDIKNDHILPYAGVINWENVMKALAYVDYSGDLTYEIHRMLINTPTELTPEKLKYSIKIGDYLISLFEKYKRK